MNCLVTGATGFIGRQLCQHLAARGDAVMPLSRSGTPLAGCLPARAMDLTIATPDADLLHGVDTIFHLAGIAHRRAAASDYQLLHVDGTLRLARAAAAAGVRCLVFLSSVKAMGPAAGGKVRSESVCVAPEDAYGLSKWQAECALREEFSRSDMAVLIIRPALVYGPGAGGNLQLLARAVRRGLPRPPPGGGRSMVALTDLVDLLCRVAGSPPAGVTTWIACDEHIYSTRDIHDLLRRAAGLPVGRAWLPRWGWRVAATLLDLLASRRGEPTFDKLFSSELYDASAVREATGWQPRGNFHATAVALMAPGGSGAA